MQDWISGKLPMDRELPLRKVTDVLETGRISNNVLVSEVTTTDGWLILIQ